MTTLLLGKPLADLLLQRNAIVTLCHSYTTQLEQHLYMADIVISTVGKPQLIKTCKQDAVIIDVGINVVEGGKIVGDVDFDAIAGIASACTPVPNVVGSVVTSCVLARAIF